MKKLTLTMIGAAALLATVAHADDKKSDATVKGKPAQTAPAAATDGKIELQVKGMT